MRWVLCYLNPNDYVTFKTDISDFAESLEYQKFIAFIFPHIRNDNTGFLEFLNRYMTLYIDIEQKHWSVYRKEYRKVEFDELLEFNNQREEVKKREKSVSKLGDIGLYKNTINNIFNKKHNYDKPNNAGAGTGTSISAFFNKYRRESGKK